MFGRDFILKLFDAKLSDAEIQTRELVDQLLHRLIEESKLRTTNPPESPEFDQHFHYCLFHLYDYANEFNWHEMDLCDAPANDAESIDRKLLYAQEFIEFQAQLNLANAMLRASRKESPKSIIKSPIQSSVLTVKSSKSIVGSAGSSTSSKRRVRFSDNLGKPNTTRSYKDSQSTLAINLCLFGLDIFVEQLVTGLILWSNKESGSINLVRKLKNSKHKLNTSQLTSLLQQMKRNNDIQLRGLEQLNLIKQKYLMQYMLEIVSARYSERVRNYQRIPQIRAFLWTRLWMGQKQIARNLAAQYLQTILDLILLEINAPPSELTTNSRNTSTSENPKIYENQKNFINSWLNLDDWLYKRGSRETETIKTTSYLDIKNSSKSSMGKFKSSSRILAQMDNLSEFSMLLIHELSYKISSKLVQSYFLRLILVGLERAFEITSNQLLPQLMASRKRGVLSFESVKSTSSQIDHQAMIAGINSLAAKVRCLKCSHIFSALHAIVCIIDKRYGLNLSDQSALEAKLDEFTEKCSK